MLGLLRLDTRTANVLEMAKKQSELVVPVFLREHKHFAAFFI